MSAAEEYAAELGGFVLARGTVDRVTERRGDTEWLAAAWADPQARVLVLDQGQALVRFGEQDAELVLIGSAEAPEGLQFLLGVDDAGVTYFGVLGPPGWLETHGADPDPAGPAAEQQTVSEQAACSDTVCCSASGSAGSGSAPCVSSQPGGPSTPK